jgi:hypothetical protein
MLAAMAGNPARRPILLHRRISLLVLNPPPSSSGAEAEAPTLFQMGSTRFTGTGAQSTK